jgi:hypothetical protein
VRLTLEQPSSVVPLNNNYSAVSTFIVAVTVDSLSKEMLGGAQFFASLHHLTVKWSPLESPAWAK